MSSATTRLKNMNDYKKKKNKMYRVFWMANICIHWVIKIIRASLKEDFKKNLVQLNTL